MYNVSKVSISGTEACTCIYSTSAQLDNPQFCCSIFSNVFFYFLFSQDKSKFHFQVVFLTWDLITHSSKWNTLCINRSQGMWEVWAGEIRERFTKVRKSFSKSQGTFIIWLFDFTMIYKNFANVLSLFCKQTNKKIEKKWFVVR